MLSRHDICDAHWERIEDLLPGRSGQHGGVGNDNRLFVNAIRYLAKTGIAWADLLQQVQQSVAALQPLVSEGGLTENRRSSA